MKRKSSKPMDMIIVFSYFTIIMLPQRVSIKMFFFLFLFWAAILIMNNLKGSPLNKNFLFHCALAALIFTVYSLDSVSF